MLAKLKSVMFELEKQRIAVVEFQIPQHILNYLIGSSQSAAISVLSEPSIASKIEEVERYYLWGRRVTVIPDAVIRVLSTKERGRFYEESIEPKT